MPLVKISMLNIWKPEQKRRISDGVHEALVEAFRIPADDCHHQIVEFDKRDLLYSRRTSEKYLLIEMTVFPGRSAKAKKELYEKITAKLGALGIPADDITIVLQEPPLANWGLSGKPGDEIDIGFNLKV